MTTVEQKVDAIVRHLTAACDTKYGDETVKMDPKTWRGDSFKGALMSHCPVEFLLLLADTYDWFASKDGEDRLANGVLKSYYSKLTAERARAWALRIGAGFRVSAMRATPEDGLFGKPPVEKSPDDSPFQASDAFGFDPDDGDLF